MEYKYKNKTQKPEPDPSLNPAVSTVLKTPSPSDFIITNNAEGGQPWHIQINWDKSQPQPHRISTGNKPTEGKMIQDVSQRNDHQIVSPQMKDGKISDKKPCHDEFERQPRPARSSRKIYRSSTPQIQVKPRLKRAQRREYRRKRIISKRTIRSAMIMKKLTIVRTGFKRECKEFIPAKN
jgi:hypothetical protein